MSSRDWAPRLTAVLTLPLTLTFALTAAGCGKKGPPLPPLRYVPAPTKDLALEQRGGNVLLSFSYPKTTPAGVALNGVSAIEVWEMDRPAQPAPPPAPAATTGTAGAAAAGTAAGTAAKPAATPSAGTAGTVKAATAPQTATPAPATPGTAKPPSTPTPPGTVPTPAVGAASVPPPPAALPGGFRPVDPRELEGMAKLKLKLQGPDVVAATLGEKVVITIPLPEPLPAAGATAPPAAASAVPPAGIGTTGGKSGDKTAGKPATGRASAPPSGKPAPGTSPTSAAAGAPLAPVPLVHYYAVRTTGPKGDRSAFSNQAALLPQAPPLPPGEVKLTGKAEGIEVAWTYPTPAPAAAPRPTANSAPAASPAPAANPAPANQPANQKILGFNIYRRDASAKTFGAPLRATFPDQRSLVDTTARFGESYIYSVTAIADPDPLRESAIRSEVEIKYVDRFPPAAPTDVVALAEAGKVRVVWRASAAADLAGYLVYRRAGARGDLKKLTPQPIEDVQYLDGSVTAGATYTYRVTAVDKSGNESAPGEAQTKAQ
jgi:hypothetical protein